MIRLLAALERSASPLTFAAWTAALYVLANNGQFMYFNYYVLLAEAFLHGTLYIENAPEWLTEFRWHEGKPYLFYGAFPAVILMPLVAIFGRALNLAHVSNFVGAFDVALVFILLGRLGCQGRTVCWLTAIFAFGSVHFWVSEYGNNWLFSQVVAEMFILMAAIEGLGRKRGWWVGLLFGCAVLSRNACLLALPFFFIMVNQPRVSMRRSAGLIVGLALMGAVNGWYNWARFGNVLDNGYVAGERALLNPPHGSFSLHYLVKMAPAYLWRGPTFQLQSPFVHLTDHGLSVFWTTPPFLYLFPAAWAFARRRKELSTVANLPVELKKNETFGISWEDQHWWLAAGAWMATLSMAFLYLCYNGDGWRQFGARYSLDYTPFILVLLGLYFRTGLPKAFFYLATAAFIINTWGVVYWRVNTW